MTSAVLVVSVTVAAADVAQPLTTDESPGPDRSAQLHSDQLTTSPRPPTPTPNHVNDQPITTINHVHDQLTTTDNTTTNHNQNRSRHWHPAVPFPGAAVTGSAEAAKAAPC